MNVDAGRDVNVGEDAVGRDKIVSIVGDNVAGDKIATIDQRRQQVGSQINVAGDYITPAVPSLPALHQLPPPPIDFTGHAAELAELLSNIEHGAIITGLRGMGGIGKTALALVLADKLKGKYPDAQFYLDLRGVSDKPMSSIEVMQYVIRGYHPTLKLPDDPNELAALYRSVLDGQRALLLMDNAKDGDQIKPLLPPASCLMLITSRQKFFVQGMRDPIDLSTLLPDDARTLLLKIAKRIGDFADEIAKLCGYLPLALQVSASTLAERADLQPQDFIRRLSDTQQRLQLTGVDASLQLSYDLLTPELKQTFGQLAVFPASFDATAEETICEDKDHLRLSELVRLSLAQYDETNRRYQLHDLVRLFAILRLDETDHFIAQRRHAEHYRHVLDAAGISYDRSGEGIVHGLALFDLEWNNIEAGQTWAVAHSPQLCSTYCETFGVNNLLGLRQHPRQTIRWHEDALKAARHLNDRESEGIHLGNLGISYTNLGEARKAIDFYEQALIIDREVGNRRGEGSTLGNLGIAYDDLGDARKAIEFHKQSLIISNEMGDRHGTAPSLNNLGLAYSNLGEQQKAIEFYEQSLVIFREKKDLGGEANALMNIGNSYSRIGEFRQGINFQEQALNKFREIGDRPGECNVLCSLGANYASLNEINEGIGYFKRSLVIARKVGHRSGEGRALGNLGAAYANLGETRKAIDFYEQQLTLVREIGDPRGEGNASWNMSLAVDQLGERSKAIELAEAALRIYEQIEAPNARAVRQQLAKWKGVTG